MDELLVTAPLAGWATTLRDVPDPVFAQRMLGDGMAIDPIGDTLFAPCDAVVLSIHDARHALTLRTEQGVELLIHIGVDTVALGGAGFTPLVVPGETVKRGDPLLRFDLDTLVRSAKAVVTPIIMTDTDRYTVSALAATGDIAVGDPLFRVTTRAHVAAALSSTGEAPVVRREVTLALAHGIHARPAAKIAAAARGFAAEIVLAHGDRRASATSPVAMLGLGAAHGAPIAIEARGEEADAAIAAIVGVLLDATPEEATPPETVVTLSSDEPGLHGVAAAPGLAIGPAAWFLQDDVDVPEAGDGIVSETRRLHAALAGVGSALDATVASGSQAGVIAAHRALIDDPGLVEDALAGIADGRSAAAAYRSVVRAQVAILAASGDRRIAERAEDLRDVEDRVVRALLGLDTAAAEVPPGHILLARELLPSHMIALRGAGLAGIALVDGGPTSHVAILAAGMGLPMAVAFGPAIEEVAEGEMLLLDADRGLLVLAPSEERQAEAQAILDRRRAEEEAARAAGAAPCHSADGTRIEVFANLGSVADAEAAVAEGAEGCGLLRTEFLFLDRADPPNAAEQAADYQAIADALGERPLIVRLLDVGGDKPAPYLSIAPEENPALGLRGIRVALARPEILDAQLRAILSVVPHGRCRIMVPMVAGLAELEAVIAAVDRLRGELGITADIAVGAMVETPAAAITADLIGSRAAFLSIGSNDLTQYALAMDRGNPAVAAALDGLHPAVLRLIAATGDGAGSTPIGVCGGLAGDPLAVPILLGLGVTELSVPPARVAATKALVARLSLDACRTHARAALTLPSPQAVRAHAAAFAEKVSA